MQKREIQIHIAATIMGDPFAIDSQSKEDIELGQWAFSISPKHCGDIRVDILERGVQNLFGRMIEKMRAAGVLRQGE